VDVATLPLRRFARGFILSRSARQIPVDSWVTEELGELWLARSPDVPLVSVRHQLHFVAVLGHFIDTDTWGSTEAAVVRAVQALARSQDDYLDATDAWSGRYLVIFGTASSTHAMTDATGMRSAFYALDGPFVLASHARIVARECGANSSLMVAAYREIVRAPQPVSSLGRAFRAIVGGRSRNLVMPMPGRCTPWSGVVHLTSNMALDIDTRMLTRIFPRRPVALSTPAGAAALIAPRLRRQVTALLETGRPVAMSITAGIDSRVSLAASRDVQEAVQYFTYRRGARSAEDIATARSIADAFKLNHRVLEIAPAAEPPALDVAIREATILSHGRALVTAYRLAFPSDTIHIRSNIGEVGRCQYRRSAAASTVATAAADISAEDLAMLWAHRRVQGPVVEAFDDWMTATHFRDVVDLDPLDVFYWEHRMSCWHSNVVLESDFAFDTHVLFNSRWVLERMLSIPAVVDVAVRCSGFSCASCGRSWSGGRCIDRRGGRRSARHGIGSA
jgi:hypothetical protein